VSEAVPFKYRAFLSYSHKDISWARWLHVRLEQFRIDKDLIGRRTPVGPVPKTLRPIFRDREDFSGGNTLADATVAAIDAAAALIVLCSAASAARPAVNEEVRLFRSRHPDRPVIPVIVDGAWPENFPPALRYELTSDGAITDHPVTILGPDLRETGDGRKLGLAKVVAGLTGLDTDVIFRRAERARRRTLQLISVASLAVLLVVSILGAWAEIQRSRFSSFFALATEFKAFEIPDVTDDVAHNKPGWDSPRELAQRTFDAFRQIVSEPWGVKILWFDDNPGLSRDAKEQFRNKMKGIGITIQETNDIEVAKKDAINQRFDVIIANYGNKEDRFAYQLLAEINQHGSHTPLVIYSMEVNPTFAKEARCYGAVARETEIDGLFTAVVRGIARADDTRTSDDLREKCIDGEIKPYNTAAWQQWLKEKRSGNAPRMPELNWN
jgi:TIR domain